MAHRPDGDPAPADGALPASALETVGTSPFGIYLHVPFCASRCGYCDFNTYTPAELDAAGSRADYLLAAAAELRLARRVLGSAPAAVSTVFLGGGTPTLLGAHELSALLTEIDAQFGLAAGAEVTTEANPESVDRQSLAALRAAGFTRVSFGMQSAAAHVLGTLDRAHTPGRASACVAWAHEAGFDHVNVDLIYGAPGETDEDWACSLDAAVAAGVDHVSAYALVVEDGTRLAARVRRGELPAPDDDALAERYLMADRRLSAAGLSWYEVSNWARSPAARCRHNELYWSGGDWWGVGPGAHSHVGGVRWWNVHHPSTYAARLRAGRSPAAAREIPDADARRLESVMLGLRRTEGMSLAALSGPGAAGAARAAADGRLDAGAHAAGRAVLTRRGRLLADAVVRDLTG